MLNEIPDILIEQLAQFIKSRQVKKSPFSRSNFFVNQLLEKHAEWLKDQDIPGNIVRRTSKGVFKADGLRKKFTLARSAKTTSRRPVATKFPLNSQSSSKPSGDDIFIMDESDDSGHPASCKEPDLLANPLIPPSIWKPTSAPRLVYPQVGGIDH